MKTFLYVWGEEYSALTFNQMYDPQKFYEVMLAEGKNSQTIQEEVDGEEFYAEVSIVELEIGTESLGWIRNQLMDYERSKHEDIFEVNKKETKQ